MSSYEIEIDHQMAGNFAANSAWAYVGVINNDIVIQPKVMKTAGICFPVRHDLSTQNPIIYLNTQGNNLGPALDRLANTSTALVVKNGLTTISPTNNDSNVSVRKAHDNTLGSKYVMDFNLLATKLLLLDCEKHYFEIRQSGNHLVLFAVSQKTASSSHILCDKGNVKGRSTSATWTPEVFMATGLNPDCRYSVKETNDPHRFILECFDTVAYLKESKRFNFPVMTISYDRSIN